VATDERPPTLKPDFVIGFAHAIGVNVVPGRGSIVGPLLGWHVVGRGRWPLHRITRVGVKNAAHGPEGYCRPVTG